MNTIDAFIAKQPHDYKFKIGKTEASSLTGFLAGMFCASLIFLFALAIM
jgi:hypothetical protein